MKTNVQEKEFVHDPWLTKLFDRDVYRVSGKESISETLKTLQEKPVFLFAKVPTGDLQTVAFFEERGFRLVDTHVVLEKDWNLKTSMVGSASLRFARPEDEEETALLSARNLTTSRFHLDPAIPRKVADQVKAEWARNYFRGLRGDQMVVALIQERIVGFLQLLFGDDRVTTIDLIATDIRERRKGIASDMIAFAEKQLSDFSKIRVGTQISNTASLRLYEKLGFRIVSSQYVFHYYN